MRTSDENIKLCSMRQNVYMGGHLVRRDDQEFMSGIKTITITFNLAKDHASVGLKVKSHLSGNIINRFNHIHQSSDDLLATQKNVKNEDVSADKAILHEARVDP